MKVDNPRFTWNGEVGCRDCPLSELSVGICYTWLRSHTKVKGKPGVCPTSKTYAEACRLAEQANKGE